MLATAIRTDGSGTQGNLHRKIMGGPFASFPADLVSRPLAFLSDALGGQQDSIKISLRPSPGRIVSVKFAFVEPIARVPRAVQTGCFFIQNSFFGQRTCVDMPLPWLNCWW